jgi:hypothetical protein
LELKSASVQLTTEKAVVEFENGDVPFEELKKLCNRPDLS